MADENLFMLYAFLMGIFITFVYDLLRIFRRVVSHNGFFVALEDLAFWGYCAVAVFWLMYHMSNGTLRWFAVMGALAGMLLYHKTLSGLLVKYVSLIVNKVKRIAGRFLRFLLTPVFAAGRAATKSAGKAAGGGKRMLAFIKKRLTVFCKMVRMIMYKK